MTDDYPIPDMDNTEDELKDQITKLLEALGEVLARENNLIAALEEIARDGVGLADLDREGAPMHEYRDYWRTEAHSRRDRARKALAKEEK